MIIQTRQVQVLTGNSSTSFLARQPLSCLSALIKILSTVENAIILVYDDVIVNGYSAKAWGVNTHVAWYTSPYPCTCSVRWWLTKRLACRDQRPRTGSGSASEAVRDDAHLLYLLTLTTITLTDCTKQATNQLVDWNDITALRSQANSNAVLAFKRFSQSSVSSPSSRSRISTGWLQNHQHIHTRLIMAGCHLIIN